MTPQEAQALAGIFGEALRQEIRTTRKVLAAVPEEQLDFKLGEKGRTARELMAHLAGSEAWFAESIREGDFNREEAKPPETVAGLVTWYDERIPALLEGLKELSAEQLANPLSFFGALNLPAVQYMDLWRVHSVHHRGQLSTYLRAMNAHVPDIYGGSADEPFQMPA
jgi:uncharacterized damage-inducible protein DinB